jgi:para-aminobenzoate synthetase component II
MIDNYDSFTFNLVHYFRALGQRVEVHRNDQISLEKIAHLAPKLIVISPGPGDPDHAGISLQIIKKFSGVIPILGVCLGHQCIAQHFGAKIKKAQKVMHGKISQIVHNDQGVFEKLSNPLTVTRYHSLIVDSQNFPEELTITAWTETKDKQLDEIMALEHKYLAIASVQFHPESVLTEQGSKLLENFIHRYSDVISR